MTVPSGRDGAPEQRKDMVQGKGGVAEVTGRAPEADWRRYARVTVWAVLVVLTALLLLRNRETVNVDFVFFQVAVPLFVALGVAVVLGIILGSSLVWFMGRRKSKRSATAKGKK